jgi:ribonuclease HII
MRNNATDRRQELNDTLLQQAFRGQIVAGVDEVGRGCLAGPVVVGAVILPVNTRIAGVRDSKMLSAIQRTRLAKVIKRTALAIGLGWASHAEIDAYGLTRALCLGAERALAGLEHSFDAVVLDGKHNYLQNLYRSKSVIRADNLCLSVACASVVAKVARDNFMMHQHRLYPAFGFNRNVGYATPKHLQTLAAATSPIHRRRFAPVSRALLLFDQRGAT